VPRPAVGGAGWAASVSATSRRAAGLASRKGAAGGRSAKRTACGGGRRDQPVHAAHPTAARMGRVPAATRQRTTDRPPVARSTAKRKQAARTALAGGSTTDRVLGRVMVPPGTGERPRQEVATPVPELHGRAIRRGHGRSEPESVEAARAAAICGTARRAEVPAQCTASRSAYDLPAPTGQIDHASHPGHPLVEDPPALPGQIDHASPAAPASGTICPPPAALCPPPAARHPPPAAPPPRRPATAVPLPRPLPLPLPLPSPLHGVNTRSP
jgi:hypothetical protein